MTDCLHILRGGIRSSVVRNRIESGLPNSVEECPQSRDCVDMVKGEIVLAWS